MNFKKFNFEKSTINSSNFVRCNLAESKFNGCDLKNTHFIECDLKKAIKGAKFSRDEVISLLKYFDIIIEN